MTTPGRPPSRLHDLDHECRGTLQTRIDTTHIVPISRLVSQITGFVGATGEQGAAGEPAAPTVSLRALFIAGADRLSKNGVQAGAR